MRFIIGLLSVAAAYALPCVAQEPVSTAQPLFIRTKSPGSFEVVYHRVEPTGVGAVAAGLIGAAIQGGVQSSQDSSKTQQVLPMLADSSCSPLLLQAMTATLQQEGRFAVATSEAESGALAVLEVDECGLRLVDSTQMQLASYVKLNLEYTPGGTDKSAWVEKIQVTGRNRHPFDSFVNEPGLAQAELTEALKRAGSRAANKIIYHN